MTAMATKKQAARRVAGLLLHRDNDGIGWLTEDGRFNIYRDGGFTRFCEAPHPTRDGYCDGDAPHEYTAWVIWDAVRDDYIDREADDYPSLTEAVVRVEDWYATH